MKAIKFELDPPDWDSPFGPLTAIGLTPESIKKDLPYLRNARDRVILQSSIKVLIDYPLQHPVTVTLKSPNRKYFTRAKLIRTVAQAYQKVYREEAKTATTPEEKTYQERGLIHRAPTDGKYGIYGHVLGDLVLHEVTYDSELKVFMLGIDS